MPSQIYSSRHAARDVARGACVVAWPADEPWVEPTLVLHHPPQPRCYATSQPIASALEQTSRSPSLASKTSAGNDADSQKSLSFSTNSDDSSCLVLL